MKTSSRKVYAGSLPMVLAWMTMACAGGPRAESSMDSRILTSQEIEASGFNDAYSVVQALRPQWLWTRGRSTIYETESVKVYLDDSLMGGPDYLRQIMAASIASIRFLDGLEATNRWGLDHGLGAIVIQTKRDG